MLVGSDCLYKGFYAVPKRVITYNASRSEGFGKERGHL